ncbi:MAG: Flp pilus assembly protein CpaB [Chloroflexota bacterium]|nr:Flp pilus assembly protein CpaB [Chloroflexota bacterium]
MTAAAPALRRARTWLALACGAGAAALVYMAMSAAGRQAPGPAGAPAAPLVPVVVAARPLAAGAVIGEGDVTVSEAPADGVADGALAHREDAVGRTVLYPLARGEQVLAQKLAPQGAAPGDAAAALPPGRVGVAVKVAPETAAGGLLRPGDRVDVVAALPAGVGEQEAWVACVVARDVPVLAVGQEVARPAEGGALVRGGKGAVDAGTVTLAASPEQALALWAAAQRGRLSLALRGLAGPAGQAGPQPALPLPADVADLCRGR